MPYYLVDLSDEEIEDRPVIDTFDQKLQSIISQNKNQVALQLRNDMDADTELIEWLEKWSAEFARANKEFIIAPNNPEQLECLEVSHPDQNLKYVSSIDEIQIASDEPVYEQNITFQEEYREEPVTPDDASVEQVAIEPEPEEEPPPPVIQGVSSVTEISGEYECMGCQKSRTWLKGDTILECDNPECLNPEQGWKLICDLF